MNHRGEQENESTFPHSALQRILASGFTVKVELPSLSKMKDSLSNVPKPRPSSVNSEGQYGMNESDGSHKSRFHFSSSCPTGASAICNPWSPNHLSESVKPALPSELERGRTGKAKAKGKPHRPSSEQYLFGLQSRRHPGVLLQGAARVIVRGRVPLEVKHEFADGLLHLQGHHRHHVLLLRALAVQTDLPASSKGGR